jgi:6-phosphogluconolactonase
MENLELITFTDPAALVEATAREWLSLATVAEQSKAPHLVALSGGRIAGRFLAAVTTPAKSLDTAFATTHFFWGDERCVPPDDAESNFLLARRQFLGPLAVPEQRIHRIRGELAPPLAAKDAEADLRRWAPSDETGQPVLDLVFLGMGEDGHVASLFPGEPETIMDNPAVYRPVIASKPPPQRITLGYAALRAARQVWVMVSSKGKEQALRDSLSPDGMTPLARVIRQRTRTRILVDSSEIRL